MSWLNLLSSIHHYYLNPSNHDAIVFGITASLQLRNHSVSSISKAPFVVVWWIGTSFLVTNYLVAPVAFGLIPVKYKGPVLLFLSACTVTDLACKWMMRLTSRRRNKNDDAAQQPPPPLPPPPPYDQNRLP